MQPYAAPPPKKGMSGCLIAVIVLVVVAVPVIGIMGTLAIYGVRKYLATAKTAEARNTVGAIARAAIAQYEANEPHVLCGSAIAVPASVPRAVKYQSATSGADFDTGDPKNGWRCLKFALGAPQYYQYQYHAGSGYVTPAGASAGPRGFEASAIGDLNGDKVESHFARTGAVNASGQLVLSTQLYVDNEFE
jgi:type IV pilus assembly protein PilA